MNNTPKISVVLPVYNGAPYLAAAIDSILAQTVTDFELIIIDDGSTDNSLLILQEYERCDTRVRLRSRENQNLVATLNESIDAARGEWIARMDQDDIALPNRFERQLQCLADTQADICGSWVRLFGTADSRILKHARTDRAIKMELLFGTSFAHPSVMMRTDLVKKLRYDPNWEKAEDYDLWVRAAEAGWNMANVPEVLLLYRQHPSQISSSTFNKQQEQGQKIRKRYWTNVFQSMQLPQAWVGEVLKLREPQPFGFDMDCVDSAVIALLQRNTGEAQATVFDYATRLYFRAASNCPNVAARWAGINRKFGCGLGFGTRLKLWLLSRLRIGSDSKFFGFLKILSVKVGR